MPFTRVDPRPSGRRTAHAESRPTTAEDERGACFTAPPSRWVRASGSVSRGATGSAMGLEHVCVRRSQVAVHRRGVCGSRGGRRLCGPVQLLGDGGRQGRRIRELAQAPSNLGEWSVLEHAGRTVRARECGDPPVGHGEGAADLVHEFGGGEPLLSVHGGIGLQGLAGAGGVGAPAWPGRPGHFVRRAERRSAASSPCPGRAGSPQQRVRRRCRCG